MRIIAMEKNERTGVWYRLIDIGGRYGRYGIQDNNGSKGDWEASFGNFGFNSLVSAKERFAYLLSK